MANSTGIYFADDITKPAIGSPSADTVTRPFTVTLKTALATTGATDFTIGDVICLAPIPPNCTLLGYRMYIPFLDTSTGVTLDLGDTQVLSGAVTGQLSTTSQTTPALGTSFTLTASASTSSFTATNGLLIVGNNLIVTYASLSGSTFVNCFASQPSFVIPAGAGIQQAGNTAAYQAAAVIGQSSANGVLETDFNLTGTTIATSTVVQNAIPAIYGPQYNTAIPAVTPIGPTLGSLNPVYFALRIHASPTSATTFTTQAIVGSLTYYMRGA